jgi:hypothetical protein
MFDWSGGREDPPCKKCGRRKADHCEYESIEIPEGCKCNPRDWGNPNTIPEICDCFKPSRGEPDICDECQHERGCHTIVIPYKYEVYQQQWIEENNIKSGDLLRVTRIAESGEGGWGNNWTDLMVPDTKVKFIYNAGKSGLACKTDKGENWNYPYFVLEPVRE